MKVSEVKGIKMKKRNYNKASIYASGAIEASADPDTWRKKLYRGLHKYYNVIIPDTIDCPFTKEDEEYAQWTKENFIMPDMHDVATSREFFVLLDKAVFKGAGTVSEMTLACWLGKEIVYMLNGIELKDIPGWAIGCLAGAVEVKSIEDAIEYYKRKEVQH
jgi:hypothetical protein